MDLHSSDDKVASSGNPSCADTIAVLAVAVKSVIAIIESDIQSLRLSLIWGPKIENEIIPWLIRDCIELKNTIDNYININGQRIKESTAKDCIVEINRFKFYLRSLLEMIWGELDIINLFYILDLDKPTHLVDVFSELFNAGEEFVRLLSPS